MSKKINIQTLKEYFDNYSCPEDITEAQRSSYIYGTFPDFLNQKCKNNLDQTRLKCWFDKWKTGIKYLSNHQILNCKRNQKCIDYQQSFIIKELEATLENKEVEYLPGRQRNYFFSKDIINKRLYEWMMKLNSTHGRLFVLINWEEITCIPSHINQINYEHIFEFKIDPNELINSKYLLKTILTINIESVFCPFIYISNSTQEI